MNPSLRNLKHFAAGTLILTAPCLVAAQTQPATAQNRQDEVINIDRSVDDTTDSFKILRSSDKQEINRYVTKVYPLKHANPFEILPYLRTIATLEKGNVITAWVPKEGDQASAWIQVNVPDFQIPSIDAAVAAYDVEDFASIPGDIKFSYRTKYRNAVEVADFIRSTTLSPDGLIRSDAETNTIYVQDSPSDFKRVLAQIQFYDIPAPQLDIEVTVIELTETDQTSLGLDWDAWKTALSGMGTAAYENVRINPSGGSTFESTQSIYSGLLSVDATAAARFLNYLVDEGKAEVRIQTNLTATNGTLSTLASGSDVPSYAYQYDSGTRKSVLIRAEDPVEGEGFSLAFVPTIAMNATRLDLGIAMRSPVAIDKTGTPIFSEQDVQAQLTLEQDQLYKMGGLKRGVEAVERKGIPFLKDIPVVKYLFSNEARIIRDTELYVFLKPTWTSPQLPQMDSMKIGQPVQAELISDILHKNPNISISSEDAAQLEKYFQMASE